jgi:cytoskeletal protein RodZ
MDKGKKNRAWKWWIFRHWHRRKRKHTTAVAILFQGEKQMGTLNSISETAGQSVVASVIPLEADGTTQTPSATITSQTFSVSDLSIATLTDSADGSATIAAVAAGTATVSVSAVVTDADGTVQTFSATGTVTVAKPTGRTASIAISFGTPA